jgi:putative acetyltransferase
VGFGIRSPDDGDRPAILELVGVAFAGDDGHDPQEEVDIVTATWSSGGAPAGLELVATHGDRLVGHVLPALGELDGQPTMAIAPLCVEPGHQRRGIGSALMAAALRRIEGTGWPYVLLLGHPAYYGRFGFEAAAPYGIHYSPVGADNPHFMIRRFGPGAGVERGGLFRYCWELPGPS